MRVNFTDRKDGPERLVCEAEIIFDDPGPLQGMKLVGFSLWRGADGEVYVTFPFGASNPVEDDQDERTTATRRVRVKSWILDEARHAGRLS